MARGSDFSISSILGLGEERESETRHGSMVAILGESRDSSRHCLEPHPFTAATPLHSGSATGNSTSLSYTPLSLGKEGDYMYMILKGCSGSQVATMHRTKFL